MLQCSVRGMQIVRMLYWKMETGDRKSRGRLYEGTKMRRVRNVGRVKNVGRVRNVRRVRRVRNVKMFESLKC